MGEAQLDWRTTNQVIASKQNGSWALLFNPNNQLILRRSNVGDVAASTVKVGDTTQWHYVVATKDGATERLYLDGNDVTGTVNNQTMTDNTQLLAIGQSSGGGYFNATIALQPILETCVALRGADLATHPTAYTLAYWHHPRFTSGGVGDYTQASAIWQDLYNAHADVVLNGHAHEYERFAPQDPTQHYDPTLGIASLSSASAAKTSRRLLAPSP